MCGASKESLVQQHQHSTNTHHLNPSPSPADFGTMLVGSSSHPQSGRPFAPTNSNTRSSPTPLPTEDFQPFASELANRLRTLPSLSFRCPKCATISTVDLPLLFTPQLKTSDARHHSSAGREANAPEDANVNAGKGPASAPPSAVNCRGTEAPKDAIVNASKGPAVASTPSNAEAEKETQHPDAGFENGSSKHPEAANGKKSGVSGSREKDETLLLASVRNTMAPSSCDVVEGENSNSRATESVFKVKRKSKNGEALLLKLSDLSPLFGLHVSDAAKVLGISTTSLKKARAHFGIHRWPGRKVRGLESTIDGLERTIVGQGADSGNKGARTRSEITKLQQELDELFHGTPAQITKKLHSPAVNTTNVYKRLYGHGWRSEHHNPGRQDINTGNQPNLTSGPAPPSTHKNSTGAKRTAKAKKQPKRKPKVPPCTDDPVANQQTPNAGQETPRPISSKYIRPSRCPILRSSLRLGSRDTEMKASDLEGLLPEVHDIIDVEELEVPESVVQAQNGNNMLTPKTEIGEGTGGGGVVVEEEGATIAERSAKRPKMESL